jgi:amino acid adenylation domain-containing protein
MLNQADLECGGVSCLPLTLAQEGIWFAQQVAGTGRDNSIAEIVTIDGDIDVTLFRRAIEQLLSEAESFRAVVRQRDRVLGQELLPHVDVRLEVVDLSGEEAVRARMLDRVQKDLDTPHDLSTGPLHSIALFKLGSGKWAWYYRAHHIACDGFAGMLLARRVASIYTSLVCGVNIEPTPFRPLRELIEADRSYPGSPQNSRDREFWLGEMSGFSPVTLALHDRPRTASYIHKTIELSSRLEKGLRAISPHGLTYAQLNERATRLSRLLRRSGVSVEARVAILAERSPEMIIGLLAILKAGGAYVPVEPDLPAERLRFLLDDSKPAVLMAQRRFLSRFEAMSPGISVIDLDGNEDAADCGQTSEPASQAKALPHNLAYIIYTSGSTGMPKGVAIEHRSVVSRAVWMQHAFGLGPDDIALQKTPFSFDVSVWEIFAPLLAGARVFLARSGGHRDPGYLVQTIIERSVTMAEFIPQLLNLFLQERDVLRCRSLRHVMVGGEALTAEIVRRFYEQLPDASLHNTYGPTEATVDVTRWRCAPTFERPPIGRPIANARVYVLDRQGRPLPIGAVGEIHIAGPLVARGYWNRPELTRERFLPDAFRQGSSERMFQTGDLGGFRIELGEIETHLLEHPAVKEAAVLVSRQDDSNDGHLVAYYTSKTDQFASKEELRQYLAVRLPDYMVPGAYKQLGQIPRTSSGKLDRRMLPAPTTDDFFRRAYHAPQGPIEASIGEIWAELLQASEVGRFDNFFQLRGTSITAVALVERMKARGLATDVRTVFEAPVLAELAATAGRTQTEGGFVVPANAIPNGCERIRPEMLPLANLSHEQIDRIIGMTPGGAPNVQEIYPLAPLQEGLLFHHLLMQDEDPYLVWGVLSIDSDKRLRDYIHALQTVIDRHVLRTII